MTKSDLIDDIRHEIYRVWGEEGLDSAPEAYEWLLKNYNISEEEDVKWQLILEHHTDDLPVEDQNDKEVMDFLENTHEVNKFLHVFLAKYKASSSIYTQYYTSENSRDNKDNNMNLEALKEKLKTKNIYPIQVEERISDINSNSFIGSIDDYIEAAHVLGASAVFIFTETLELEDFEYELEIDNGRLEIETEEVDLCKINNIIDNYKEYIGQVGVLKLLVRTPQCNLRFSIKEDWWLEFINIREETIDRVSEHQEAARAKQRAAQEAKEKKIIKSIGNLISDEDFVRLPTQRAMSEYAKEKIPDLDTIDALTLKREIQNINAKIKAKGLGNK